MYNQPYTVPVISTVDEDQQTTAVPNIETEFILYKIRQTALRGRDKILRPIYIGLTIIFLVSGTIFFLFPNGLVEILNMVGLKLGFTEFAPLLDEKFWLALSTAYMAVISNLSWLIAQSPSSRTILMQPLFIAKVGSSSCCLFFYLFEHHYFVYLLTVFTDGSLALLVWITYKVATR